MFTKDQEELRKETEMNGHIGKIQWQNGEAEEQIVVWTEWVEILPQNRIQKKRVKRNEDSLKPSGTTLNTATFTF